MNGDTPFIVAAKASQLDILSLLINEGADVEATDKFSLTALHWSAKNGNTAVLNFLMQNGVQIEAKTKRNDTALHLAANYNHLNIVSALLNYGACIDTENREGNTPLKIAISNGNLEIARRLKGAGASTENSEDDGVWLLNIAAVVGQSELVMKALDMICDAEEKKRGMNAALCRASQYGQHNLVSYLLDNGADIGVINDDGQPLLFVAGQYPKVISILVHRGASLEARNVKNRNQAVLHHYTFIRQINSLHLLLTCGLSIYLTDDDDNTALHYAARKGDYEVACLLLQHGADANAKNTSGETALHITIEHDLYDLACLLIDYGVDLESKTFDSKCTALHTAVETKNTKITSLLVKRHANINAIDVLERTALQIAVDRNLVRESALMIEHGANINMKDIYGQTPLHRAVANANANMVSMLLKHGASIHIRSEVGTPLSYAIFKTNYENNNDFENGFIEVIEMLIEAGADTTGIQVTKELEQKYPTLRAILSKSSDKLPNKEKTALEELSKRLDSRVEHVDETSVILKGIWGSISNKHKSKS